MQQNRKKLISDLLKGIETGDTSAVWVVNEEKYIQHNPQTQEGSEGLAELFKRLSKTSPRVNIVRVFEDGEFIFAHTEYDFQNRNIGFEIFRFEEGLAVEHWDNIQHRDGPNVSGHSMIDGCIETSDIELTETNRDKIKHFVNDVLINKNISAIDNFINVSEYCEHSPKLSDDLTDFRNLLSMSKSDEKAGLNYQKSHRVLAEGSFVLAAGEGMMHGVHSALFDLFRLENGMIVEHWDTVEAIPARSEWKNDNGKF